jgi:hypothetical protein
MRQNLKLQVRVPNNRTTQSCNIPMSYAPNKDSAIKNLILNLCVSKVLTVNSPIHKSKFYITQLFLKLKHAEICAIYKSEYFRKTISPWTSFLNNSWNRTPCALITMTRTMIKEVKSWLLITCHKSLPMRLKTKTMLWNNSKP